MPSLTFNARMSEYIGYRVYETKSPGDALKFAAKFPAKIIDLEVKFLIILLN